MSNTSTLRVVCRAPLELQNLLEKLPETSGKLRKGERQQIRLKENDDITSLGAPFHPPQPEVPPTAEQNYSHLQNPKAIA